jgi:hypothetical protein
MNYRCNNPESNYSPSIKTDITNEYKRYIMHNSSNKFHKNIPIVKDSSQMPQNYSTIEPSHHLHSQG